MNNTMNTKETGAQKLKMDQIEMRDYFAAKAMHGICAHADTWGLPTNEKIASVAYAMADAMLAARES